MCMDAWRKPVGGKKISSLGFGLLGGLCESDFERKKINFFFSENHCEGP